MAACGLTCSCTLCVVQASYALGYNLAIEYLADYEKTWMLDSFRDLSTRYMAAQGRNINWVFLEVHAEGVYRVQKGRVHPACATTVMGPQQRSAAPNSMVCGLGTL